MSYADSKIIKTSIFLKVEQGAPHTVRLLDESPTEQFQHKINGKLVQCSGEMCPACGEGIAKSQRFITNIYDHTEGGVKLWSYGPSVAQTLKDMAITLAKDGEDILNHDIEITVQGAGMQKKTSLQLRMKSLPVPPALKLHHIGAKEDVVPF